MQSHNKSFSFNQLSCETSSQPSPRFKKDMCQYEQSLMKSLTNISQYFQKHPISAPEISISTTQTNHLHLSQQLKFSYNIGLGIDGEPTLYQILIFAILLHFYSDKRNQKKLKEFKIMIYGDQLEKYLMNIVSANKKQSHLQVNSNSYEQLKSCLAHIFRLLQKQTKDKTQSESYYSLITLLTNNKQFISYLVIVLRALVQHQSIFYKMDIQHYSTRQLKTQPQIDILDIVTQYFELTINMIYIDEGFLRQQTFQGSNRSKTIDIIINQNSFQMPIYTYLHNTMKQQQEIIDQQYTISQQKTNNDQIKQQPIPEIIMPPTNVIEQQSLNVIDIKQFYKSNSSADRELNSLIQQKQTLEIISQDNNIYQNTKYIPQAKIIQMIQQPLQETIKLDKYKQHSKAQTKLQQSFKYQVKQTQTQKNDKQFPIEDFRRIIENHHKALNSQQHCQSKQIVNGSKQFAQQIENIEKKIADIQIFKQDYQKTQRKPRVKRRNPQHNPTLLKQSFEQTMKQIKKQSSNVMSKADMLIQRVESTIKKSQRGIHKYQVQKLVDVVVKPKNQRVNR